ncbi:MAG TPA: hypothetical protein VKC54_04605 [Patescibacteria group bacterium]|nr:hypothetical protein [Patescibacteria group bacterium]
MEKLPKRNKIEELATGFSISLDKMFLRLGKFTIRLTTAEEDDPYDYVLLTSWQDDGRIQNRASTIDEMVKFYLVATNKAPDHEFTHVLGIETIDHIKRAISEKSDELETLKSLEEDVLSLLYKPR